MTKTRDEGIAELRQAVAALIAENERLKGGVKMKPEITKEQAEAIKFLRKDYSDVQIIEMRSKGKGCLLLIKGDRACGSIYDLSIIELAAALINGYEIVMTPEEKVREFFDYNHERHERSEALSPEDHYTTGVSQGIKRTLEHLGIKIEGVNA